MDGKKGAKKLRKDGEKRAGKCKEGRNEGRTDGRNE